MRGVVCAGVGFAVLSAAVALGRQDLLIVGVALVALPAAAVVHLRFHRQRPDARLRVEPSTVRAGGEAFLSIRLVGAAQNDSAALPWRYALPDGLDDLGPSAARSRTSRGSLQRRVGAKRRGVFWLGPIYFDVTDLFGLARHRTWAGRRTPVVVVPAPVPVAWPPGLDAHAGHSARNAQHGFGGPLDGFAARPYRPGDPIRRVQWPATARFGELMVRQEEQPRPRDVWLVADTRSDPGTHGRAHAPRPGDDESFELALRVIASVAELCVTAGRDLHILEVGTRQLAGEKRGAEYASYRPTGARTMLPRELARLSPAGNGDPDGAMERIARSPGKGAAIVVVTRPGRDDLASGLAAPAPDCTAAVVVATGPLDPAVRARLTLAGWSVIDPGVTESGEMAVAS
jgi:uncharacterized protein (DUF58 family)